MTDRRDGSTDAPLADLVAASLAGDTAAWARLVQRLERVVWKAVNLMTNDPEVRKDAFAATWLRLVERLDTIREPHKLPGWLTTTATNEVRQIIRHRSRQNVLVDFSSPQETLSLAARLGNEVDGEHERDLVRTETNRMLRRAFEGLDEDCRQLLTVLILGDPPLSYREASELLGRPVGALGPSRQRCLDKLRATPEVQAWRDVQPN